MPKKDNYCNQKNTQCNQNAQLWYMTNAMKKIKTTKNPIEKMKQIAILNYYLNGHYYSINN